jgi:hypothetical protein
MKHNVVYLDGSQMMGGLTTMMTSMGWARTLITVAAGISIAAVVQSFIVDATPSYWRIQLLLVMLPAVGAWVFIRRAATTLSETVLASKQEPNQDG